MKKVVLALTVVLLWAGSLHATAPLNRIQQENPQPGTVAWQLTNPAENRQIEGYASLTSVPVGGNISLFVSTSDPLFTLTVFRMGWYGGTGGRRVMGPQILPGVMMAVPGSAEIFDRALRLLQAKKVVVPTIATAKLIRRQP
jgi:hypothetical protein